MQLEIDSNETSAKPALGANSTAPSQIGWRKLLAVREKVSPALAGLVVFTTVLYMFFGHVSEKLGPYGTLQFARPRATSGDEPHYLVIINSLVYDHDLRIDPDYARVRQGGFEAGAAWRGGDLGGHAILIDRRTGRSALCAEHCDDAALKKVGGHPRDLAMFPAHPVGYPAFMALLALPFHPAPSQLEGLVGTFGILVSIAVILLTYAAARVSGVASRPAVAAALVLGFASSWLPYARSYFSEVSIGLCLILSFLALRRERPILCGLAIGAALAMKSVNVLFGFVWIAERLWARQFKQALWIGASIGLCGVLQVGLNLIMLKSPATVGSGTFSSADGLNSLMATLFSHDHGLVLFIPWALIPLLWWPFAVRATPDDAPGRLSLDARRQIALPVALSLLLYSCIGWGPGYCYGPRYWVPVLPFLALLVIDFAMVGRVWRQYAVATLAAAAMLVAVPGAIKYHKLFMKPATTALFYEP
jgi:hypothetical protein